jgi:methionine-rich copper-binding protein CopC
MNPNTVNNNNIALYVNGAVIRPTVFRSADGRQVTLTANNPSASMVSVIMTDDVTDLSGNALSPYISTFMTGMLNNDTARPTISRQIPSNGSSGWIGLDQILLYTSEPMDVSSIDDAFHITEDGVLIDDQGTLEVLGDGRTIRFTKDTPFTEDRYVQVFLSSAATDDSGNAISNYNAYFRTGISSDLVGFRPIVNAYHPGNNQTGVPVNPVVFIQYNEALDTSTLTSDNIKLQNADDGFSDVATTVTFDDTLNLLKVVPDNDLIADTRYYLWLSGDIEDTDDDRQNRTYTTNFYTAADGSRDDRQPTVMAQSPTSGQTDVGVNTLYASRYDESMNPLTFDYGIGSQRRFNAQFSEDNQVVRYERLGSLPELTEITEPTPAMVDLAGNAVVPRDTIFTSANGPDIINPSRIFISVLDGATNVPTNPVIESLFNEPIDPVSITSNVRLYDTITGLNVPTTVELSDDGLRLVMVPNEALLVSRRYYVYKYGLRDLSGNGVVNFFSQFITGVEVDNVGPVLDNSTLFDGISNIPTNVYIRERFNEPLSVLELAGVTIEDSMGINIPINVSLSGDRRTINVVPKDLLLENTMFSLNVADISDLSGNLLSSAIIQNFTTASGTDLLQGSEVYRSIPNAVTNVPRNAVFEVGLSERLDPSSVQLGTNSYNLYNTNSRQIVASTFTVSADGLTLTLIPEDLLEESRQYYWYVGYSPYLYDLANNFIAINSFSLFTTGTQEDEDSPILLSSSIVDGTTDIPVSARVTLTFNEPLSNNCYQSLSLTDGITDIIMLVVLSSDRKTVTLTPASDLAISTVYTVVFTVICDYAGNTLSGNALSFTTSDSGITDSTAPQISSVVPSNNASGISVDTNIVLTFDETIEADSIVRVYNNAGQLVPGSVDVAGSVLTFDPDDALATNNRHRIEIRYNIFDLSGNQRYHGDSYFTTEL